MQNRLMSFLGLGIFIALLIVSIFIFSYIFIIGALVGLVLFVIDYIRNRFSHHGKRINGRNDGFTHPSHQGRTIEYRDDDH